MCETKALIEQLRQSSAQQNDAGAQRLAGLEAKVAGLEGRLDALVQEQKAAASVANGQLAALKTSIETLAARNTDVMRQTMDFTNNSARRWTKELDGYRTLFKDSVFDNIWKELGTIYVNIVKRMERLNNPELTKEMEYYALEPIMELMEGYGVTKIVSEPNEKRSMKRTRSKAQRYTGDQSLDAAVVRSLLPGFARGEFCLIPEIVESYIYKEGYVEPPQETAEPECDNAATETGACAAEPDPCAEKAADQAEQTQETRDAAPCANAEEADVAPEASQSDSPCGEQPAPAEEGTETCAGEAEAAGSEGDQTPAEETGTADTEAEPANEPSNV